jgi:hypothetical protein
MTAANHALTGTFIGLSLGNPWLALPLAFASHFVCDAIPHFDVPGKTAEDRMSSRQFLYIQIIMGAVLCGLIVLGLALSRPEHWFLAALCAFAAASPDLLYVPRYMYLKKTGRDSVDRFWFWKFHNAIQWFQRPVGFIVEIVWAAGMVILISPFVR